MARYSYLIFLTSLILASCAQVGTITGGEQDISAPKPIADKVNPPNASVNFSGNEIVIPFDEYFTLSSPGTSIQIVPPHATIKTSVNKKTLTLTWNDTLRDNTTYAIYLNNTVKDLSEKNDSIMQYVFSTGNTLDSITYSVSIVDAYTNSPLDESVVALYDPTTKALVNFAQSDRSGKAKLTYLKPGTYEIIAFKDENNDLIAQETEEVGFLVDSLLTIDSSSTLLTPIRMFKPLLKPEILSSKFQAPATFLIETSINIENPSVSIDGVLIDSSQYFLEEPTKLQVFVNPTELNAGKIALTTSSFSDTTNYRILDAQKKGDVRISSTQESKTFAPSQAFSFKLNDLIQEIDTSLIHIRSVEDSTLVPFEFSFSKNVITFDVKRGSTQELQVEFESNAITSSMGKSVAFDAVMKLNSTKKYGTLSLDVSSYSSAIIIQVIKGSKLIQEKSVEPSSERVFIHEVSPGDYSFKIIRDDNKNGIWDSGDFNTRTLPEQIDQYSKATTVRANWEVEVELVPTELTE